MIGLVGAFSLYFYIANQQQRRGLKTLEGVVRLIPFLSDLNHPDDENSPDSDTLTSKLDWSVTLT
jgi:hypothetical protein